MDSTQTAADTSAATRPTQLLGFDHDEGRTKFTRAPFSLHHELSDHPLFTMEAIAELADILPVDQVEHNLGSVDALVPDGEVPRLDLSPGEVVRGIDTNGCWIVLVGGQDTPQYKPLFEELMDELAPLVDGGRKAMSGYHSALILAAPGSTTPSHLDPELGFLLHIRGDKRISIGRFADAESERAELESFYGGGHRNTHSLPVDAKHFDLAPGEGVHVPPWTPHWVDNGAKVAVSLSVGFRTPANLRRERVLLWNARIAKRLGWSPKPPGESPARDAVKSAAVSSGAKAKQLLRRGA